MSALADIVSEPIYGDADWREYRRLVLSELESIRTETRTLGERMEAYRRIDTDQIMQLHIEVAMLKAKAGALGTIGGFVASVIVMLIVKFLRL